mmetsp:Transcript_28287/g.59084  ORF Transcript_28287/g.59084 Transcript_28287/m.59084 type:complete len:225 (-) Transcript_28287:492-1166(-)
MKTLGRSIHGSLPIPASIPNSPARGLADGPCTSTPLTSLAIWCRASAALLNISCITTRVTVMMLRRLSPPSSCCMSDAILRENTLATMALRVGTSMGSTVLVVTESWRNPSCLSFASSSCSRATVDRRDCTNLRMTSRLSRTKAASSAVRPVSSCMVSSSDLPEHSKMRSVSDSFPITMPRLNMSYSGPRSVPSITPLSASTCWWYLTPSVMMFSCLYHDATLL